MSEIEDFDLSNPEHLAMITRIGAHCVAEGLPLPEHLRPALASFLMSAADRAEAAEPKKRGRPPLTFAQKLRWTLLVLSIQQRAKITQEEAFAAAEKKIFKSPEHIRNIFHEDDARRRAAVEQFKLLDEVGIIERLIDNKVFTG